MGKKETNFIDYFIILIKWKKLITISSLIVFMLAIVYSLFLTKYYKASVLFLPPASSSGLKSILENFSVDILGGEDITGDVCVSILNSRELREEIIKKHDLMKVYKKKYIEHTLKVLGSNVIINSKMQVGIGTSNIISISISVIDKSPERAANMANDFFNLLEERIIELNTQKARNNRLFLEKRVAQNRVELTSAEDSLEAFQEKFGAIEITAQAQAAIETAAKVKADLIKAKIMREVMLTYLSRNHAEVLKLQSQISALTKEYEQLHDGNSDLAKGRDVMLSIAKIPNLGLHYYRLLREVEIQNKLLEMLVPLFEQAKIQEVKTVPVLRVIDRAVPPTYKYKPKRAFIVLGIVAVYFASCILYIFFHEFLNRLEAEDSEQYQKIKSIFDTFKLKRKFKI